jgi:hypothetical protein
MYLQKNEIWHSDCREILGKQSVFLRNRFIIKAHYLLALKLGCQRGTDDTQQQLEKIIHDKKFRKQQ